MGGTSSTAASLNDTKPTTRPRGSEATKRTAVAWACSSPVGGTSVVCINRKQLEGGRATHRTYQDQPDDPPAGCLSERDGIKATCVTMRRQL